MSGYVVVVCYRWVVNVGIIIYFALHVSESGFFFLSFFF